MRLSNLIEEKKSKLCSAGHPYFTHTIQTVHGEIKKMGNCYGHLVRPASVFYVSIQEDVVTNLKMKWKGI